jgi:hypothetical protein
VRPSGTMPQSQLEKSFQSHFITASGECVALLAGIPTAFILFLVRVNLSLMLDIPHPSCRGDEPRNRYSRPHLISLTTKLPEKEKWRLEIRSNLLITTAYFNEIGIIRQHISQECLSTSVNPTGPAIIRNTHGTRIKSPLTKAKE